VTHDVRAERTGWRCEAISRRHREWGYNCPAVDLDFVVAEYNHGKPVALIEYKEKRAQPPDALHPTYQALIALADGYKAGSIPCLIAVYCAEHWWFQVYPLNDSARRHYQHLKADERITEQRFVRSLYLLRQKTLTQEDEWAIAQLNTSVAGDEEPRSPECPTLSPTSPPPSSATSTARGGLHSASQSTST